LGALACLNIDELADLELEDSQPFLAFPLVNMQISSDDLIAELQKSTDISLNEDNIYTAFFTSDSFVQSKQDLFPKTVFGLPIPIFDSVVTLPVPIVDQTVLTRGVLKGDQLIFAFNSNETTDVLVTIRIADLSKNGQPLTATFVIPFDGAAPSSLTTAPIELDGFEVDFSKGSLTLQYDARRPDNSRVVLPLSFAQITAFDFSYLEGTIGQSEIPLGLQSIDIDIQDSLIEGTYQFEDPRIHFKIDNSFGIPIGIKVKEVFVVLSTMERQQLESSLFDELIFLEYPRFEQMGMVISDSITFDRNNSNIQQLVQNNIIAIEYDIDVIINPKNERTTQFFVLDTSAAIFNAEVELSFNATVENVSVRKSIDVDLAGLDSLSYLRLKLVAENGIPLSFVTDLLLQDTLTNKEIMLNGTPDSQINSSITTPAGIVESVSENIIYYELDAGQLADAVEYNKLSVVARLQSPLLGSIPTIIKPGQAMIVRIGAEAKLK
jgi:hypothetical protein